MRFSVLWTLALGLAAGGAVVACPYSIRDSGFIVREPDPFRLLVAVRDDTPDRSALERLLREAAGLYLPDTDIEAALLNLDAPPSVDAEFISGVAEAVGEAVPAAVLVSPRGDLKVLPGLGPDSAGKDALHGLVRGVAHSEARDEIARRIVAHWCVVLIAEGEDNVENDLVARAVRAATRSVAGAATEMGRISTPPHAITLARDDRSEDVFAWSVGLDEGNAAGARVAVLFGMGRRLGPVIPAADITESLLVDLFHLLGRNCTCTADPRWLLGPRAPLLWGMEREVEVRDALGFDPHNPLVIHSLAGAWVFLRNPRADWGAPELSDLDSFRQAMPADPAGGYTEIIIDPDAGEPGDEPEAPLIDMRARDAAAARGPLGPVLMVAAALVIIALAGGVIILLRRRGQG